MHGDSSFLTLTYSPENLPADGSVSPRDLTLFLKKLRKNLGRKIRYFAVGEYGDHTQRPHYHLALFGVSLADHPIVQHSWGKGHILLGDLTSDSAQYICGYITKKMTKADDPRLKGRHPEFARMSLKPGLGAKFIDGMIASLDKASSTIADVGDVPSKLRTFGKLLPMGRYLHGKLRSAAGVDVERASQASTKEQAREMFVLLEGVFGDSAYASKSLGRIVSDLGIQKARNLESKFKVKNKRGSL